MQTFHFVRASVVALGLTCLIGCGEKMPELPSMQDIKEGVQGAVGSGVDDVAQAANLAGSLELQAGEPVAAGGCYISLIAVGGGRPAVLRLASYKDASNENYPSVFLQAQTDAADLASLSGQTVSAQLFVQRVKDGPVLHCATGQSVQVKFSAVAADKIEGEISGGALVNTADGTSVPVSGKFTALPQ